MKYSIDSVNWSCVKLSSICANGSKAAFTRATFSWENRHFVFFLSQIEKEARATEKEKAKCKFLQLKVARINAA